MSTVELPKPDMSPEMMAKWDAFLASVPDRIRPIAESRPPWVIYRIKATGDLCVVASVDESDPPSFTVLVPVEWNPESLLSVMLGDRSVFGLSVDDIEPVEQAS